MNSISCQQLTEALQSIQLLNRGCGEVLSAGEANRRNKIQILTELKKTTAEIFDQLVVKLKDGRSLHVDD